MDANDKILTFPFGTFSCSLQKCDDTLEAMIIIAKYFQKRTQKDQFSGTELLNLDANTMRYLPYRMGILGIPLVLRAQRLF